MWTRVRGIHSGIPRGNTRKPRSCVYRPVVADRSDRRKPSTDRWSRAQARASATLLRRGGGAAEWLGKTAGCGWKIGHRVRPAARKAGLDLWPDPGNDLEWMRRIKVMFDASGVLNAGRMYGRI